MKLHKKDTAYINCPICFSSEFETLIRNDRYNMKIKTVGCVTCGLIFSNPMPLESFIENFYTSQYRKYYQGTEIPSEIYIEKHGKTERVSYTADFIYPLIEDRCFNSICDIGSSEGIFLNEIRQRGFSGELFGIEPNVNFSNHTKNIKTYKKLDHLQENSIDCITLIHSFEHIRNPNETLENIKLLLKSNGILFIDIPDASAYLSLESFHIAHLYHYTTNTIEYILAKHGFDITCIEKHTPPNHPESLRIIATPSNQITRNSSSYSNKDTTTWRKIREISIAKYFSRKIISKTISTIPFGRTIYNYTKKAFKPQ